MYCEGLGCVSCATTAAVITPTVFGRPIWPPFDQFV